MEPSSREPEFGDADYDIAAFGREVSSGKIRWLATILAAASALLLIGILAGLLPPDLQWPIYASGRTAKVIVIGAVVFWSVIAGVNWRAFLRNCSSSTSGAVQEYVDQFREAGLGGRGASGSQVKRLEEKSGPLPASYKAYLLMAGRRPPRGWVGTDCTIGKLADVRVWAEEVLRENDQPPLPARAFVFMMHQGYQFHYFEADSASDDPPVFYYMEGESVARKFEHLSEMVVACAERGRGGREVK